MRRRCGVVCQKVIHPQRCLEQACPFLYSYEAFGRSYTGCTQGIFAVAVGSAAQIDGRGQVGKELGFQLGESLGGLLGELLERHAGPSDAKGQPGCQRLRPCGIETAGWKKST